MKSLFNISAVAVFLVVASGVCFALWDVDVVTKDRAKQLGLEIRSTASGTSHVSVELEFKVDGPLKSFSEVHLRLGTRENLVLSTTLREDRSKPGRILCSFAVDSAQLDKLTLSILVPFRDGGAGGTVHEIRVKDFVEVKKSS